jgi:hypothetical protein
MAVPTNLNAGGLSKLHYRRHNNTRYTPFKWLSIPILSVIYRIKHLKHKDMRTTVLMGFVR